MARTDNFTNFATDVADSIREKTGKTDKIPAANFDTEIKNIVVDVGITLQDKSIEIIENGTINITADEGYDGLNKVEVVTNVASSSEGGGASGGSSLNIFTQLEQPEETKGVWLKTDENITVDNVTIKPYTVTHSTSVEDLSTSTPTATSYNRAAKVGDYIYVFCGRLSSNSPTNVAYKCNINTGEITTITSYPLTVMMQAIGCVGTDIYLFGGKTTSVYYSTSYKYDTLTDTYTQITDLPITLAESGYATLGTDIYIVGGTQGNAFKNTLYKYDTLTDTYTELATMPIANRLSAVVPYDKYLYIFCPGLTAGYNATIYKYNISSNEYTSITNAGGPGQSHAAAGCIGNDMFIVGGYNGSGRNWVYHFDPRTEKYTTMPTLPATRYNPGFVSDGVNIYLVGGQSSSGYLSSVTKLSDSITVDIETSSNEMLVNTSSSIKTTNITDNIIVGFNNVHYSNNEGAVQPVEVYTNNGETWEHV